MFEHTVIELLQRAPELLALIVVVGIFVRYMHQKDDVIKDVSAQCHAVQSNTHAVMEKTIEQLGRTEAVLISTQVTRDRVNTTLARINGGK